MGQVGRCAPVMFSEVCFNLSESCRPVLGALQSFALNSCPVFSIRRQAVLQKVDELSDAAQQREREVAVRVRRVIMRVCRPAFRHVKVGKTWPAEHRSSL